MKRSGHGVLPLFACLLMIFTAYVLLDSFVIERKIALAPADTSAELISREKENTAPAASPLTSAIGEAPEPVTETTAEEETETVSEIYRTDRSYSDENMTVTLTEERVGDTTVYIADVILQSADSLGTALAENTYGRNVTATTTDIAASVDAVLAVNGDFYGSQRAGYVIRGGVLYRDEAKRGAEDLVIYADGSFAIVRESEVTAAQLLADGARDVLSFGPALIEDGQIAVSEGEEVGRAKASNPRTAIAVIDPLHYLFVVSDGRTEESEGLSLYELAELLQSKGAATAYNLDGGGSSTMVFNGRVVNNPTSGGSRVKERSVSDIVYVG